MRLGRLGVVRIGLGGDDDADELLNLAILLGRRRDEVDPDRARRDGFRRLERCSPNGRDRGPVACGRRLHDGMDEDHAGLLFGRLKAVEQELHEINSVCRQAGQQSGRMADTAARGACVPNWNYVFPLR